MIIVFVLFYVLFPQIIHWISKRWCTRIPFKNHLFSIEWTGYIRFKLNIQSWNRIRFTIILSNVHLTLHQSANPNHQRNGNLPTTNRRESNLHSNNDDDDDDGNRAKSIPSILKRQHLWRALQYLSIEFADISISLHLEDIGEPITLQSMHFCLENFRHSKTLAHSLIFKSFAFQCVVDDHSFLYLNALRIHSIINIQSVLHRDDCNAIQHLNIQWKGLDVHCNRLISDFMISVLHKLNELKHRKNAQNAPNEPSSSSIFHPPSPTQQHSKQSVTDLVPFIPHSLSLNIELIRIHNHHHDERHRFQLSKLSFRSHIYHPFHSNYNLDTKLNEFSEFF